MYEQFIYDILKLKNKTKCLLQLDNSKFYYEIWKCVHNTKVKKANLPKWVENLCPSKKATQIVYI